MSGRSRGRLSYDTVFTTLSNPRRRYVLEYLQDNDGNAELREVTEHLAAWENEKTVDEITSQERRRVYTALQQVHLPKMDEDGIVAFDSNRGTVRMTGRAEELRVYLEVVQGSEIPWSEYYLGLSAVCVALVVAAYFDVLPTAVPSLGLAGGIAVLFALSAAVNVYRQRRRQLEFAPTDDGDANAEAVAEGTGDRGENENGNENGNGDDGGDAATPGDHETESEVPG